MEKMLANRQIKSEQALAILEVARRLGLSTDLDELLQLIVAETVRVLDCQRATLFLYDPDNQQLYSRIATGSEQIRFDISRGIAGACARDRQIINVPDAYADDRFNPDIDKQSGFRTRNLLACPLIDYHHHLVGVLQAINKRTGKFTDQDQWLAQTLSSQAAVALQRAKLLQEYAHKQQMEHELDIARSIQQGLLPKCPPQVPGFDIAGWNKPADQTGGDCFDYVSLPDGRVAILLADASGHGIGPALVVAHCRAMFRALLAAELPLDQLLGHINDQLCQDLPDDRFVTAFFGLLEPEACRVLYCSAGQGPILHLQPHNNTASVFPASCCPLSIIPHMNFELEPPLQMQPGDVLLLVTDGFVEWTNPDDQQFGTDRLIEIVNGNPRDSAEALLIKIRQAVANFAQGTEQQDDLTGIVIKRLD